MAPSSMAITGSVRIADDSSEFNSVIAVEPLGGFAYHTHSVRSIQCRFPEIHSQRNSRVINKFNQIDAYFSFNVSIINIFAFECAEEGVRELCAYMHSVDDTPMCKQVVGWAQYPMHEYYLHEMS